MNCLICNKLVVLDQRELELVNLIEVLCDFLSLNSSHYEDSLLSSSNDLLCTNCLDRMTSVAQQLNQIKLIQKELKEVKHKVEEEIIYSYQESIKLKGIGNGNENDNMRNLQKIRQDICKDLLLLPQLLQEPEDFENENELLSDYIEIKKEKDDMTEYELSESSFPNSPFSNLHLDEKSLDLDYLKEKAMKNDSILKIKRLEDLTSEEIGEAFSSSVDTNQKDDSNSNNEECPVENNIESIAKWLITKPEKSTIRPKIIKKNPKPDESLNDEPQNIKGFRIRKYGDESSVNELLRENSSEFGKFKLTCRVCLMKFKSHPDLKVHVWEVHNNEIVKCLDPNCDKMFRSLGDSRYHYKRVHLKSKQTTKDSLPQTSVNDSEISNESKKKIIRLTCQVCSLKFKTSVKLKAHQLEVHQNKIVECRDPKCFKMFKSLKHSGLHYRRVHLKLYGNRSRSLCPICGKDVVLLDNHLKTHDRETYECEICKKVLASKLCYRSHFKTFHSESPRESFVCPTCGKILGTMSSLRMHEKTVHERMYKYKCDLCDFGSPTLKGFKIHQLTHFNEKTYVCAEPGCDQKYKSRTGLNQHKLTHTGEKPHKCKTCGKGFRSTSQRGVHETIHTPHITTCACEICGKKFTHKAYLNLHVNWHKRVEARGNGPPKLKPRKPKEPTNEFQQ